MADVLLAKNLKRQRTDFGTINSTKSQEAGRGVWAGSGVKGHRAAKGAERAGGGWRLRRLFIFGGRVTEAGTRVRSVRQWEKSGGRPQHAQLGDGCGEWLGVPAWAQTPSLARLFGLLSQVPVSGPVSQLLLPSVCEAHPSWRLHSGGAGPHFPLRSALAASCAAYRVLFRPRGLVPRRSASLAAGAGHSLIHCADQQSQGAGCVLGVGGDEGEFRGQSDTALALGTRSLPGHFAAGKKWLLAHTTCFTGGKSGTGRSEHLLRLTYGALPLTPFSHISFNQGDLLIRKTDRVIHLSEVVLGLSIAFR